VWLKADVRDSIGHAAAEFVWLSRGRAIAAVWQSLQPKRRRCYQTKGGPAGGYNYLNNHSVKRIMDFSAAYFSPDYFAARDRFRGVVDYAGWELESHPVSARGPQGQELTVDVAHRPAEAGAPTLLLTTGLHGPEGFFGSAVACAILHWAVKTPNVRIILVHALNPFGFSHVRRTDEDNIDLNRNFLVAGDSYGGSAPAYRHLDSWLNPQEPLFKRRGFIPCLAWSAFRLGIPALKQTIAGGQYDFAQGLFYGGSAPSSTYRLLESNLHRWVENSSTILHLDFHTGLGRWSTHKLLVDANQINEQAAWVQSCVDADLIDRPGPGGIAYHTRGSIGNWCGAALAPARYVYFCAEFGTYSVWQVLAGLRAENQAHHWAGPSSSQAIRAKARLVELFCPRSPDWRRRTVYDSIQLVRKALQGLARAGGKNENAVRSKVPGGVNAPILSP
jgi:predicted deacylase